MINCILFLFLALLCGMVRGQCECNLACELEPDTFACCLQVNENSPPGTQVGFATAEQEILSISMMRDIMYMISINEHFGINQTTGEIFVLANANLDAEGDQCIQISVTIEETSTSRLFGIEIVDVNDNPPAFSSNRVEILVPETTTDHPTIDCSTQTIQLRNLQATDEDEGLNAMVSLSILDSADFIISDQSSGTPCIQNTVPLDRDNENYQPYEFTLVATDSGNPPLNATLTVVLSLTGVNEFPPSFISDNSDIQVAEDRPSGFVFHKFEATDMDVFDEPNRFTYELESTSCPFEINTTTGEFSLGTMGVDAENSIFQYECLIRVSDQQGLSNTTTVTVTISDVNEPATVSVFGGEDTVIEVQENERTLSSPFWQIQDQDRVYTNNTVQIISGGEYFALGDPLGQSNNFFQSFVLIGPIDRENYTGGNLTVRLVEDGVPTFSNQTATFEVRIKDANDNPPELNLSSVNVVEEQPAGEFSIIALISSFVVDRDEGENAEVNSITLISAVGSEAEVDMTQDFINAQVPPVRELGSVGRLRAPRIDRERSGSVITINVNITDNGNPSLWSIADFIVRVIDVNDNAPEFTNTSYSFSITENMPSGTPVGAVLASDPDEGENGTVIYSLNSPYFVIDGNGAITTTTPLDRETVSMYVLYISAHDNGPPEERQMAERRVRVNISVLDEDDNPPMFDNNQSSIFETLTNTPNNTQIATIQANDPDEGDNGRIRFELTSNNVFRIDHDTGDIYFKTIQTSASEFNLTVTLTTVSNTSFGVTRDIVIRVTDPRDPLTQEVIITIGCAAGLFTALVLISIVAICCCYCRHRRGQYNVKNTTHLNNQPERVNSIAKPILKSVPAAANGSAANRERVTQVKFSDMVAETHYDRQGAVIDDKVLRKASITNFGSSDESPHAPTRGSPIHNGVVPSMGPIQVLELENSPAQIMNGITSELPGLHPCYEMHPLPQHSPKHMRQNMTVGGEFSQGTSTTTDANSYNSDSEDSTFSDGDSNMNTSIPCFNKDDHQSELHRYPPPAHPPLYLHHSPHMPSPSLLGVIHPGNMSSLAAEGSYRTSQGNGYPPHHSQNHPSMSDSSSQTTIPSPRHSRHEILNRMEPSPIRGIHSHTNGHSYSRPLVMPDAYPTGVPVIHRDHSRHELSISDYGETSTYASIELDEVLHCDYNELEPGFYSLTATDYGDHEDT